MATSTTPGAAIDLILRTASFEPAIRSMGEAAILADIKALKEETARAQAGATSAQETTNDWAAQILAVTGTSSIDELEAWFAKVKKYEAELPALRAQVEAQRETAASVEVDRLKRQLASTEGELRAKKGELSRAWGEVINLEERLRLALAGAATTEANASREVRQAKVDALLNDYASWGRISPVEKEELTEQFVQRFDNDPEKVEAHLKAYYSQSKINTGRAAVERLVKARVSGALEMTPAQLHELHDEDPDAFEVVMQERREARG